MAGKKPRTFDVSSSFPAGMEYYYQPSSGDEERIPHSLLIEYMEETDDFAKGRPSLSIEDTDTVDIPAGKEVASIIIKTTGTPTVSVGTSAAGSDVIDSEVLVNGLNPVFKVAHFFETAGSLHFTVSSGTITVWLKIL